MNKILISSLGIFLSCAANIFGMDIDTFHRLLGMYNDKEITCQDLVDAYDQIDSIDVRQAADAFLAAQGTSWAALKGKSEQEHELFTQTFDALVRLYRDGEVSRAQLIKAYNLFEREEDKALGNQVLDVLLNTSIDQLRNDQVQHRPGPARQQRPSRNTHPAPHEHRGRYRRNRQRAIEQGNPPRAPQEQAGAQGVRGNRRRRPNTVEEHLSQVREQNELRRLAQLERVQMREQTYRLQEAQDMQEALRRSREDQYQLVVPAIEVDPVVPVRREPAPQAQQPRNSLVQLLDQSQARQANQDRLRQELRGNGAPAPRESEQSQPQAPRPLVRQAQDDIGNQPRPQPASLDLFAADLSDVQAERNAQQARLREQLRGNGAPAPREAEQSQSHGLRPIGRHAQGGAEQSRPQAAPLDLFASDLSEAQAERDAQQVRMREQLKEKVPAQDHQRSLVREATEKRVAPLKQNPAARQEPQPLLKKEPSEGEKALAVIAEQPKKDVQGAPKSQKERIALLRQQGQEIQRPVQQPEPAAPKREECSVNLSISTGTPVFTKGNHVYNPTMIEAFNKGLASVDRETIATWATQYAKLATSDEERQRILKPLIKAFSQPDAPQEQISMLMQSVVNDFQDHAKYQELTRLV